MDQLVEDLAEAQNISILVNSPPEATVITSALKNWNLDKLLEKIGEYLEIGKNGGGAAAS